MKKTFKILLQQPIRKLESSTWLLRAELWRPEFLRWLEPLSDFLYKRRHSITPKNSIDRNSLWIEMTSDSRDGKMQNDIWHQNKQNYFIIRHWKNSKYTKNANLAVIYAQLMPYDNERGVQKKLKRRSKKNNQRVHPEKQINYFSKNGCNIL